MRPVAPDFFATKPRSSSDVSPLGSPLALFVLGSSAVLALVAGAYLARSRVW